MFYDILNNVLAKHVRMKQKRVKRYVKPDWYTDEIKHIINERDKYHKTVKIKTLIDIKFLETNQHNALIRKIKKIKLIALSRKIKLLDIYGII